MCLGKRQVPVNTGTDNVLSLSQRFTQLQTRQISGASVVLKDRLVCVYTFNPRSSFFFPSRACLELHVHASLYSRVSMTIFGLVSIWAIEANTVCFFLTQVSSFLSAFCFVLLVHDISPAFITGLPLSISNFEGYTSFSLPNVQRRNVFNSHTSLYNIPEDPPPRFAVLFIMDWTKKRFGTDQESCGTIVAEPTRSPADQEIEVRRISQLCRSSTDRSSTHFCLKSFRGFFFVQHICRSDLIYYQTPQ